MVRSGSVTRLCIAAIVFVLAGLDALPSAMSAEPSARSTFVSPDKAFQFEYPSSLILCQPDSRQEDLWRPADSCGAYIPVCNPTAPGAIIACLAYPAAEYAGSMFEAAAFVVAVLKERTTESTCLSGWRAETINGVRFKEGTNGWVGMGNVQDNSFYRTFHEGTCYELDNQHFSSGRYWVRAR